MFINVTTGIAKSTEIEKFSKHIKKFLHKIPRSSVHKGIFSSKSCSMILWCCLFKNADKYRQKLKNIYFRYIFISLFSFEAISGKIFIMQKQSLTVLLHYKNNFVSFNCLNNISDSLRLSCQIPSVQNTRWSQRFHQKRTIPPRIQLLLQIWQANLGSFRYEKYRVSFFVPMILFGFYSNKSE